MKEKKKNDNIDEQIDKISKEIYTYSYLLVSLSLQISLSLCLFLTHSLSLSLCIPIFPSVPLPSVPLFISICLFISFSVTLSLILSFSHTHSHYSTDLIPDCVVCSWSRMTWHSMLSLFDQYEEHMEEWIFRRKIILWKWKS